MSLNEFENLLERYITDCCTDEERQWIENWLSTSTLSEVSQWDNLPTAQKDIFVAELFDAIILDNQSATKIQKLPGRHKIGKYSWIAASLVISLASAAMVYVYQEYWKQEQIQQQEQQEWLSLKVPVGESKKIVLSDGTAVWMQGGSSLQYPKRFGAVASRTVQFEGDGFFEVTKNPQCPFFIKMEKLQTKVLGTSFHIQAYKELHNKSISLIEGKIAVHAEQEMQEKENIADVILVPNEAVEYDDRQGTLIKKQLSNNLSAEYYKTGNLEFAETPLSDALFRISQIYGVEIQVNNPKSKQHKITAIFYRTDPIRKVLASISQSTQSKVDWTSNKIAKIIL
ncbi:FecR family protein [Sphingobacterium humi]|uniref:DUF4974 domain-containing protein n=1 Tax=Sphingobacterium humi TaxID=1796905 RepID=A0A6N8KYN6_9SPHI|nr:FecR family protein [Sphingobacterium humi]MVZ62593.1 DUF4974 domain-containing protein [Sphingobacterium humi]